MSPGDSDDTRETTELEAPTLSAEKAHRRGRSLWLPLVVFVALLVASALVGRYIVPAGGPDSGAAPPSPAGPSAPETEQAQPDPKLTLPPLPTPPVRPADQLAAWAQRIGMAVQIPTVAVQAYGYAQLLMQDTDPQCHLSWTTLAGIGEVESTHGQADGAVLEPGGRSTPPILGQLLDGQGGRALARDTDAGAFDGDATYDRTMGPLRLMPAVWRANAMDADGDGILDPYDIDDAALAAARLICSGNEDLDQRTGWNAAIARVKAGQTYTRSVFDAADSYGQRTQSLV